MMASGHQVMGVTWGVGALTMSHALPLQIEGLWMSVSFLAVVMLGALLPDMDSMSSKIGRFVYPIAFLIVVILAGLWTWRPDMFQTLIQQEGTFVIAIGLPVALVFSTHRTWTHSLTFLAIVAGYFQLLSIWFTIPSYLQIALLIGIASHLFGDFLTKQGIPLLYPLSKRRFRFLVTFQSGSWMEKGVVLLLVFMNAWLFLSA